MKLTPLLPLLTLCVAINGCSDPGDEAPVSKPQAPEPTTFSNVAVNPRAYWTTTAQRESVVIAATQLTFPASGNDDLLARQAGDILVSDRSTKGNNPHGFLRKVVSVARQGSTIVITTEHAFLNEVIVGQFDVVAQPDDLRAMTAEELGPEAVNYDVVPGQGGPGLSPLGEVSAGFDLGGDVKDRKLFGFSTPALKVPVKGHDFEIKGTAEATLKEGSFHFKPSIRVGGEIDTPDGVWDKFNPVNYVDEFHVITKGEVTTKLEIAGSGKITTESPDGLPKAVQEGMKDLSSRINGKIQGNKAAESLALTLVKLPFVGPPLPTPVGPIPMTYEFEIKLECRASLTGGLEASIGFSGQSTAEFGTKYERSKGWSPIKSFEMGITKIGPNYTANGAVGVECALKPKLSTKVAGVAGPFLEIAGKIGAEGSYKESCDGINDARPKGEIQASVKAGFEVAIGAEAKLSVLSYEVNLGEASFPLYNKEWPIWESGSGEN
ncbi:MAG: hypothetical protein EOO74_02580 [Myxococcales bacterium]|nr:MAG: hypothetical protein EOO74_02580 [Myxococcales bacterium]